MLATLLIRRQFGQAVLGLKILGLGRANADGESWSGRLYAGLINPKRPTLGSTLAGKIEAVGKAVKQFKPGDQVYGTIASFGSHADYICLPEDGAITRPLPSRHHSLRCPSYETMGNLQPSVIKYVTSKQRMLEGRL